MNNMVDAFVTGFGFALGIGSAVLVLGSLFLIYVYIREMI